MSRQKSLDAPKMSLHDGFPTRSCYNGKDHRRTDWHATTYAYSDNRTPLGIASRFQRPMTQGVLQPSLHSQCYRAPETNSTPAETDDLQTPIGKRVLFCQSRHHLSHGRENPQSLVQEFEWNLICLETTIHRHYFPNRPAVSPHNFRCRISHH